MVRPEDFTALDTLTLEQIEQLFAAPQVLPQALQLFRAGRGYSAAAVPGAVFFEW